MGERRWEYSILQARIPGLALSLSVRIRADRGDNMAKKNKFNYFDAFEQQVDIASEEADLLVEAIENFKDAESLRDVLDRAHEIEHRGDMVNHEIRTSVSIDFITPFDREDIIELANDLDDVIDMIEGVIQRFYMFDVHFMHPRAMEFAKVIQKSLKALRKSMGSFREFKKVKKIRAMVEDVNNQEETADAMYVEAIRELYTTDAENAVRVEVWSRLFDRLEAICDATKTVADTMSTIMLKNV